MKRLRARSLVIFLTLAALGYGSYRHFAPKPYRNVLEKSDLRTLFASAGVANRFPTEIDVKYAKKTQLARVEYTLDPALQREMTELFERYQPEYGAFVAIEPGTGRILAMVSYTRDQRREENLTTRATFPSASVFKVVTAAAAITNQNYSDQTPIRFNGGNHTLYRSQILKEHTNRWTRTMSLREAFAKSVNPVFGKLGAWVVGPEALRDFAGRFGFNRAIPSDVPVDPGSAPIPHDPWGLAEAASGFTRENTMSPLQGAWIAAAVANDGVLMEPHLIDQVSVEGEERDSGRISLYRSSPVRASIAIDPGVASELRTLFRSTISQGTSSGVFRGFARQTGNGIDVGGKTGSLTGLNPKGKYDWFVGYASDPSGKRIALAALSIHGEYWRVKSSFLARRAVEHYFATEIKALRQVASVQRRASHSVQ